MEIFIYPWYSGEGRFLNRLCIFHPNSKSELARLGRALCVHFLPLSDSDWKTLSSSLLLQLKGEFTKHVSLSESSLKLPPSESESFKISLILSASIKFL